MSDRTLQAGPIARGNARAARLAKMTDDRMRECAAAAATLQGQGWTGPRTASRYNADAPQSQPIAQPSPVPISPISTPPRAIAKPEDFSAAKTAYRNYFTGANGGDRGRAFVEFGIALGIVPKTACGLTGGQAQCDHISTILHSEISAFKYDREQAIKRTPQLPQ